MASRLDRKHNRSNVPAARELRRNMTKEERKLWYEFLRFYPVKFSRQKILGKYIADFYSAETELVIELDGSQHLSETGRKNDAERTEYLEKFGLTVIRIPNNQIKYNFIGVCEYIDSIVKKRQKEKQYLQ